MAAIQTLCASAYLLDQGRITAAGKTEQVVEQYLRTVSGTDRTYLADRKDRRGDGRLRFVEFAATSGDPPAALMCGKPATFTVRYRGAAPSRNVALHICVFTTIGEGALYLDNEMVGQPFTELPAEGAMVCRLERMPLLPGNYSVNLFCTINGVMADWVIDAARFDIGGGDFFGTGKLPPHGYGLMAADHRWDVVS
jgi:lipopolysaccharide transport system ATP-binding protein